MAGKEKAPGLAGTGAEIEVGVTDCVDDNTTPPVMSTGKPDSTYRTSYTKTVRDVTMDYLSGLDPDDPPSAQEAHEGLMEATFRAFYTRNAICEKEDKWPYPARPNNWQTAQWVMWRLRMAVIETEWEDCTDEQRIASRKIGRYVEETGIYSTDIEDIARYARDFDPFMKERDVEEVMAAIKAELELAGRVVRPCRDPNLVWVGNGIYDVEAKGLRPFTPDLVSLTRSSVNYNPNAKCPVITMPDGVKWDIESAMLEFAGGDPGVNLLLWQMLASAVRPGVYTGKMLVFYGRHGNNGKGTVITLARNLVGPSSCGAYPLAAYGEDSNNRFELKGIEKISANLVDENDILHIASASRLRAAITGDVFKVQVKGKDSYFARQRGVNVQCVNDLPTFKSKGGNILRRVIIVPFDTCFTGVERDYIKHDYMARTDVLEYVLKKVLEMPFKGFCEPERCKRMLQVFEEGNNAVLEFLYEFMPRMTWDLAPKAFLYDLYKAWHADVNPSGKRVQRDEFWELVEDAVARHGDSIGWATTGKRIDSCGREVDKAVRPGNMMDGPEPLAVEYALEKWTSRKMVDGTYQYVGEPEKRSASYAGLRRVGPPPAPEPEDDADRAAYEAFLDAFRELDATEPGKVPVGPHGWRKAYPVDGTWHVNDDLYPDSAIVCPDKPPDGDGPITFEVWLQHMQLCPKEPAKRPDIDFDCDVCRIHYRAGWDIEGGDGHVG